MYKTLLIKCLRLHQKIILKIVVQKDEKPQVSAQKIKNMDKSIKIVIENTKVINEGFDLLLEFPKGFLKALKFGQPI